MRLATERADGMTLSQRLEQQRAARTRCSDDEHRSFDARLANTCDGSGCPAGLRRQDRAQHPALEHRMRRYAIRAHDESFAELARRAARRVAQLFELAAGIGALAE